jgi:Tfp pilus assembly protein PilO
MRPRASRVRIRLAFLSAFLLAANLILFAAFTWPKLSSVKRAEARAVEVSKRRAALEKLWSLLTARRELLARNRKDIESLGRDHLRYRSEDLFGAQREIEKLARDSGLKPKRSSYSLSKVKGTDLVRCEVTLPLDGSYASLTGFLGRIESEKRFIVVDQMALSEEEGGARMNLKLSAIFKEKEGESGAAQ